jgi:hypothetical protein
MMEEKTRKEKNHNMLEKALLSHGKLFVLRRH